MKKFIVAIEETVLQEFEVFAENSEEALKTVVNKYKRGEFVLEPGILVAKQMAIIEPNKKVTEWVEL